MNTWSFNAGVLIRLDNQICTGPSHTDPIQDKQVKLLNNHHHHPYHHRDRWSEGERQLPLNDVGCLSYLTVGWVTATMWKAFRVIIIWTTKKTITMIMKTMTMMMTMMSAMIEMIMLSGGFDPNGRVRDRRS